MSRRRAIGTLAVVAVVGVIVGVLVRDMVRKYAAKVNGRVTVEGTRDGSLSLLYQVSYAPVMRENGGDAADSNPVSPGLVARRPCRR